jgi:sulfate/thiosulfate transport system substrate-binding protein
VFEKTRYDLINWRLVIQRVVFSVVLLGLLLYAIWPWLPGMQGTPRRTVLVYGFSILGEVMTEGIFPAFQSEWQTRTGEDVEFISSFAGSGTITNQLILGVPAEVAILSLELDAWRLVENGVLPGPNWRDLPYGGVLNRTPFIILTRLGNPQQIGDFSDLTQPGIGIVHPDPMTSGGAQWAILAEYGSVLRSTGDEEQAYRQLAEIWANVVAQAASARAARTQFEGGFGDILITYEQEVLLDREQGQLVGEIIYPYSTILSEHIVVVIDDDILIENRELVEAFVAFLWNETAQRVFVDYGFRSVDEELNIQNPAFGEIRDPFTVNDLGGWLQAKEVIIDSIWRSRVMSEVNR